MGDVNTWEEMILIAELERLSDESCDFACDMLALMEGWDGVYSRDV